MNMNYLILFLQTLADETNFNNLGGIAIVLFILKEVFTFIRGFVPSSNGIADQQGPLAKIRDNNISRIRSDVAWIKEAHNVKDEDGKFIWYFPKSMERAINANTLATKENTSILKNMKL